VELAGADTDFRAEPVTVSVRKSSGAIVVDTCVIHQKHKLFRGIFIFRDDAVGVMGAVFIDMIYRLVQRIDDLYGDDIIKIFLPEIRFRSGFAIDDPIGFLAAANGNQFIVESLFKRCRSFSAAALWTSRVSAALQAAAY
jgi:hypothetical protein